MDEVTQKIIIDKIKSLPEDIKTAISSVDRQLELQKITERQNLLIDQAGKLETETTLVMIGLEPLSGFVENLARELEIPLPRAKEIALDVSEHIFKPIRESLQKMSDKIEEESAESNNMSGIEIERSGQITAPEPIPAEASLDRSAILQGIENPTEIKKDETTTLVTTADAPYQKDPNIKTEAPRLSVLETKMAGMTITPERIVENVTETKLPPVEKKRPTSGVDPYREPIE